MSVRKCIDKFGLGIEDSPQAMAKLILERYNRLVKSSNKLGSDLVSSKQITNLQDFLDDFNKPKVKPEPKKVGPKDKFEDKVLAMEIKLTLHGDFIKLTHLVHKDGKSVGVYVGGKLNQTKTVERLNETIQDPEWRAIQKNIDMITLIGVRIPVQGMNSMEHMVVKEFLAKEGGNIIIPPSEIVAKSGSDFDIDKLTIMMPSIDLIGGVPEITEELENDNSHKINQERAKDIKVQIKELKEKKKTISKEFTDKFKQLSGADLAPEEAIKKAKLDQDFESHIKTVDEQVDLLENEISYFTEKEDSLTQSQQAAYDESFEELETLYDIHDSLTEKYNEDLKEIADENYQKSLAAFQVDQKKALGNIVDDINKLTKEKSGLSANAIENSMMFNIRNVLELKKNFVNLITPNATSLVKPLADILSKNRDYSSKEQAHGTSTAIMQATRALEPAYNVTKHEHNAVGKETLGLGAIDNTFNTLLTRVGAYMNPEYFTKTGVKRVVIKMKHNTLQPLTGKYKGQDLISLSHLYDVNNENKISEVINQMMNGWVDVAKDAWIFDIQGNKQVSPVLLFMIQAGVPFEQAVLFVSNPLVKEYVKQQKIVSGVFAGPLGLQAEDFKLAKHHAKMRVFDKIGLADITPSEINKLTVSMTDKVDFDQKVQGLSDLSLFKATTDETAKAAFLHYLELEKSSDGIKEIKMKLNYDTSRSNTLFDAQQAEADLINLYDDNRFPNEILNKLLTESPIAAFRIAPFQLDLWGPLFKLRNNANLNGFLINKISRNSKSMEKVYGTTERYVEEFKNDVIVKIFTDQLKKFDINDLSYRGLHMDSTSTVAKVDYLSRGVVVQDGTIYIDQDTLNTHFKEDVFTKYNAYGLASIPLKAFVNSKGTYKDEFIRFSIEREYLRHANPFSEMSKTHYFTERFRVNESNSKLFEGESKDEQSDRLLKQTYEEILRDSALDNTMNLWKLFSSDNTVADQLQEMKFMHPKLVEDNHLINDLIISEGNTTKVNPQGKTVTDDTYTNLALRDNRVDRDSIELYHKQITELADSSINSIPITTESTEADYAENKRIAEFFQKLPLVAFLQSGLNVTDPLSMVKIMPTEKIAQIIESAGADILNNLDLTRFKNMFDLHNSRKNISIRRRLKSYVNNTKEATPDYKLAKSHMEPKEIFVIKFPQVTLDKIVSGEITGMSRVDVDVKEGDILEIVKEFFEDGQQFTRSVYVEVTRESLPVELYDDERWAQAEGLTATAHFSIKNKGYNQFLFKLVDLDNVIFDTKPNEFRVINPSSKIQLESLVKNNPSLIFVLGNNALSSEPNVTTIDTTSKETIDASLERVEELMNDTSAELIFLDSQLGYGNALFTTDKITFDHLSSELFNKFKYINKNATSVTQVQDLIQQAQEVTEYSLDISYSDLDEARQRLTCKI